MHGQFSGRGGSGAWVLAGIVAAVLAAVWFAGCGGGSSEDSESGAASSTGETTVEVTDEDSGEVSRITVTGSGDESKMEVVKEDGSATFSMAGTNEIPADFPADFPRYEGWEVKTVVSTDKEGEKGFVIAAMTSDSVDKVVAAYEKAFVDKKYKIGAKMTMPQGTNIVVEKDKVSAVVTIGAAQGKTVINVTLAIEK